MSFDRRQFVAGAVAGAGLSVLPKLLRAAVLPADRRLKILILGGTGFLGPHTVDYALKRGHEVTLFNRGKTNSNLYPELETIIGDRDPEVDAGLSGLKNRQWDAVIDNSGFVPRIVGASSQLLSDNVEQYVFVSTICQYANWIEGGVDGTEATPRDVLEDPTTEDVRTHYCALKAYCELAVEAAMQGRVTQIRPGLIVGPRDGTDRFTYWPVRIHRGGDVLAPGKPSDLTQYIDVRDLAEFMVHCVEQKLTDSYNLVRPPMPFGEFLGACLNEIDSAAELVWIPAEFLEAHAVQGWRDVHLWADSASPGAGAFLWSSQKALHDGLRIRPVETTIRATLDWFNLQTDERQEKLRSGMSREKELEVLAAWRSR